MKNSNNYAVQVAENKNPGNFITLTTGVILKAKRVPNLAFADLVRRFNSIRPKTPVVFNADLGRDEENPNDPSYIESMEYYNSQVAMAIVDLMIMIGTEPVSIPDEIAKVEDTAWQSDFRTLGFNVGETPKALYLSWVKYIAAISEEDIPAIMEGVGRLSGVSERDVADAIDNFRDNSQ